MKFSIFYILLLSIFVFISCSSKNENQLKIKLVGIVDSRFIINTDIYNENKDKYEYIFSGIDTSKYDNIENIITGDSSNITITDSLIIRNVKYEVNDELICCKIDSSKYFIENINNKKYLLLSRGEGFLICEIENGNKINTRERRNIQIPTWNTEFNTILKENEFKDSLHTSEYTQYKSEYSIFLQNRDIELTTLKFPDKNERVISQIHKELDENDVKIFVEYMKLKYPKIILKEYINNKNLKDLYYSNDGFLVWISEKGNSKSEIISNSYNKKYNFYYVDFYTLSKSLLTRIGEKYKLIDYNHVIMEK
jgi:hypothetical protein